METEAKDKALTGAAGAYYVAFRLSAMGYAVGLTAYGTRSVDMVVANVDTGNSVTIQTKTGQKPFKQNKDEDGPFWTWPLGKKIYLRPKAKTFFYAFVDLGGSDHKTPYVFIVPSIELSPPLVSEFGGKETGKETSYFCDIYKKDQEKYFERWDVIRDALL